MPRSRLLSALLLVCAALCAGCDESAGSDGQSTSKSKDARHRTHASKKDRNKADEPTGEFKLGRIDVKKIPESSGVIASRKNPGVFWTHNDSGNGPVLFAMTRQGKLLGEFTINARNTDWEAITTDDDGHLYIGDTGNNNHRRDRLLVYRVDEPVVEIADDDKAPASGTLRVGATWRLKFPEQPFDCESLFLCKGKGYVISKLLTGKQAVLYSFDLAPQQDAATLERVCDLPIRAPVTDAAIAPDEQRLAVMTLTGPYLFDIAGDVAAAGRVEPKHYTYFNPKDMNMEGVCFVPEGLLATTEQGQILLFAEKYFK